MQYLKGFSEKLLEWYEIYKRDLPWRQTKDPFKIWLSEIIMQQTRVQQGLPYYERFTEKYRDVKQLASAPLDEVMRIWQGLGYYSRARNLHSAALQVVEQFDGVLPQTFEQLLLLKGVGRYTAAAIASFAYNEKVAVADGNVLRVISRIFGVEDDISIPRTVQNIEKISSAHICEINPGIYNQAIMEFGALFCTPSKPDCQNCIFKTSCFAYKHDLTDKLPVKLSKVKIRTRHFDYIIIRWKDKIALRQRTGKDIWQGLYEYVLIEGQEQKNIESLESELEIILNEPVSLNQVAGPFLHVLTHQKIHARFFLYSVKNCVNIEKLGYNFYTFDETENLAKSVLLLKFNIKEVFL